MKKILALFVTIAMAFSMIACNASEPENTEKDAPAEIELTEDNILDYLEVELTFSDFDYEYILYTYFSSGDVNIHTYAVEDGTFSQVRLVVRPVNIPTYMGTQEWYPTGDSDADIEFEFRLPADGEYDSSINITCANNSGTLNGSCDFEIVSVSGTFIPD